MNLILTRPLVVLDCETTGTSPALDRIVSVACLRILPDGTKHHWSTLVNPERPIPVEATAVHRITDAMVIGAPTFASLAPVLFDVLEHVDIAGYRVKFDKAILTESWVRERLPCPFTDDTRILDAARLWQVLEPRTLEDAVARWCPELLEWFKAHSHDASADVTAAIAVLKAQLGPLFAAEGGQTTVDALHQILWPWPEGALDPDGKIVWKDGAARWTFGKHAGDNVQLARPDYLEWVAGPKTDFSPEVKALARRVLRGETLEPRTV